MGWTDRLWRGLGFGRARGLLTDSRGWYPVDSRGTPTAAGASWLRTEAQWRRDSLTNSLTGLGGDTDKGSVAVPNTGRTGLSDDYLRALFEFNGIARRIVALLPSRATRRGWTAPECEDEERRLRLYAQVRRAMTWARLYGGAGLLLVTEDDVPPGFRGVPTAWLREPLDLSRVGRLVAVQALDAFEASPYLIDRDPRSPGYRGPLYWSVTAPGILSTVHASRVVWFRGDERPSVSQWSTMPDASVLQAVWDEVRRLSETMAGGAILAAQLYDAVLKIQGYHDLRNADQEAAFLDRLQLTVQSRSMLGFTVMDANDDFVTQANPPNGFRDLSGAALEMLCTVLGWPRVMLTGEAPGGMSTDDESGKERERAVVSDYQENNREPLEYLYRVIYAAQDGPTSGAEPEGWRLEFCPLDEPTEKERAEVRAIVAQTDATYISAGVYGPADVAESRFGEDGWSFDMQPVEPPDDDPDAMVAAALARMGVQLPGAEPDPDGDGEAESEAEPDEDADPDGESEADTDGDEDEPTEEAERADAGPRSAVVWVPAADPGLRGAVERAIGQQLRAENEPHVTVLYLGDLPEDGLDEVERDIVGNVVHVADEHRPGMLERGVVRAFPFSPSEGTPVVIEFDEAWVLERINDALLRALAHRVVAKQFPRFRAHLTLGYAIGPLSPEALAALATVDASAVRVPVSALVVRVGQRVLATVPVGGG